MSPRNVALDAGMIRPRSSISPSTRSGSGSVVTRASWVTSPEAVRPYAEVTLGIDRVAAERAVGPAGAQHLLGALHERPGRTGRDPDQEHLVRLGLLEVLVVEVGHLLGRDHRGLAVGEDLDHEPL